MITMQSRLEDAMDKIRALESENTQLRYDFDMTTKRKKELENKCKSQDTTIQKLKQHICYLNGQIVAYQDCIKQIQ